MINLKKFFKKEEKRINIFERLKKKIVIEKRKRALLQVRKHKLRDYLLKSGIELNSTKVSKWIFNFCIFINLVISAYILYHFSNNFGYTLPYLLVLMAVLWFLGFIVVVFAVWALFYIVLDLNSFKRKLAVEEVLPDFLQLTASNIKAGMNIDKALWYAVRPRFGVLAKEIEVVAKETMGGEDLRVALEKFTAKYDSVILKRSISLLIEGINAGGEVGSLLNKIAINIEELKIRKKEMAASVTTYAIFITFATVVAAPILFSLSGLLITVIKKLSANMGDISASASRGLAISFSGVGIDYLDFKIFAIASLTTTSFFSSMIIATIKKGNVKEGMKYIPIFIFSSVTLFLIAEYFIQKAANLFF